MKEESKLIELFKKYPGIAARIRRSFAYHYDQIQREIESEVATINKDDAATIIDYITEFMDSSMNWPDPDNQTNAATIIDYTTEFIEESMNWPDSDNQTNFNNQLA